MGNSDGRQRAELLTASGQILLAVQQRTSASASTELTTAAGAAPTSSRTPLPTVARPPGHPGRPRRVTTLLRADLAPETAAKSMWTGPTTPQNGPKELAIQNLSANSSEPATSTRQSAAAAGGAAARAGVAASGADHLDTALHAHRGVGVAHDAACRRVVLGCQLARGRAPSDSPARRLTAPTWGRTGSRFPATCRIVDSSTPGNVGCTRSSVDKMFELASLEGDRGT